MEESKIAIKLEEETKPIKKMCEKLMDAVNHELDKGIENVNAQELGEVIDMIKDLYEAKEKMVKSCYYKQIMEAMEESEYGEDYDEEGPMDDMRRGYRGQPRDSMGRFMSRRGRGGRGRGGRRGYEEPMYRMTPEMYREHDPEYWRDMDVTEGRMYYSSGGSGSSGSSGGSSGGTQSSGSMSGGSSGENMGGSSSGMSGGSRGYSEGGNYDGNRGGGRDSREGRSGEKRRGYMEAKEMGKDKQSKMKELEEYMKSMAEDLTEAIEGATPEERAMAKNKLSVLVQKM